MSQTVVQPVSVPQRLKLLYEPIRGELAQVEEILRAEIRSSSPAIDELVKHAFRLGGKRLRPALLLLAAKALGPVRHEHLVLSAVVEMVHTATLVHDDVLDEAAVRRHLDTVNARWSNQSSVLLGDFLFSHAFYLASTVGSTFACEMIGRSTNIVCEGELSQVANRGNLDLSEDQYLRIIEAKTAELCACCCRLGAHYAHASPEVAVAMERYGRHLGIAFQITDDLLDLVGEEETTGKSLGSDLAQQKLTLPLIRLIAEAPGAERRRVLALIESSGDQQRRELQELLDRSDALEYTRKRAQGYARRAVEQLRILPRSRQRAALRRLARFVLERSQ